MVITKFVCNNNSGGVIDLTAVYSGSKENEEFFKLTPAGSIKLQTVNEKAAEQFEVGKEYYVKFEKVNNE